MRKKKRYLLFEKMPAELPPEAKFLFQTEEGFVIRVAPKDAEKLRNRCLRISGSVRKLKSPKTPK